MIDRLARAPQKALVALVRGYQLFFSAWIGSGCRYSPTCSYYALGALRRHGAVAGTGLATWRVLRCHPGCAGGLDPVPDMPPRWLTRAAFHRNHTAHTEPVQRASSEISP